MRVAGLARSLPPQSQMLTCTVKVPRPPRPDVTQERRRLSSSRAGGTGTRPLPSLTVFQGRANPTPPLSDTAAPSSRTRETPWWPGGVGASQVSLVAGGVLGAGSWTSPSD